MSARTATVLFAFISLIYLANATYEKKIIKEFEVDLTGNSLCGCFSMSFGPLTQNSYANFSILVTIDGEYSGNNVAMVLFNSFKIDLTLEDVNSQQHWVSTPKSLRPIYNDILASGGRVPFSLSVPSNEAHSIHTLDIVLKSDTIIYKTYSGNTCQVDGFCQLKNNFVQNGGSIFAFTFILFVLFFIMTILILLAIRLKRMRGYSDPLKTETAYVIEDNMQRIDNENMYQSTTNPNYGDCSLGLFPQLVNHGSNPPPQQTMQPQEENIPHYDEDSSRVYVNHNEGTHQQPNSKGYLKLGETSMN